LEECDCGTELSKSQLKDRLQHYIVRGGTETPIPNALMLSSILRGVVLDQLQI